MKPHIPVPANEAERLEALLDYHMLDTLPEEELDAITKLASYICQTPIALITLLDGERQWFKSRIGVDAQETKRDISFCQYAIMGKDLFEVPNALEDERFVDNPLVTGSPEIRFYAGVPLETPGGLNLGSLCVVDSVPRSLSTEQKEALKVLSRQVMVHFEIRKQNELLKKEQYELERLSMVAKANTKGVLFISKDGKISWCNDGFTGLMQYTRKEIFENYYYDLFGGALTQKEVLIEMVQAFISGAPVETEIIMYRKDRTSFWADLKIQPLKDENDQLKEYFAIVEDINEKKKAEVLLKESETRMSALIQNLHAGILLKDESRRVVLANKEFYQLFQLPPSNDLTGKEYVKITEQLQHLFKNPAAFAKRIDQILQANETVLEEVLEMADGRYLARDYIPIFVGTTYKGHLWKYTDITERKSYERNLKAQEEKYRSIITNMNLGLVELDLEGKIQSVNLTFCRNLGYSAKELLGEKVSRFLGLEDAAEPGKQSRLNLQHIPDNTQLAVQNKRGELRWWLLSGAPNLNETGEQTGNIIINLDISEHKKLEAELQVARHEAEESAKAKDQFFATMSHEIRTPLNAIIGMVMELSKDRLTEKQCIYLKHATSASQHLLSLVNNILDFSKMEAGEFQLDKRTFNLQEVLRNTETIMSPAAREKMLDFKCTISKNIAPALVGDPNRLRQVLINLISNAIKFTEKGCITILCEPEATNSYTQRVKITITDTGIGMEEAYLKDIFRKFSQEDISTARKYGGTGLGMPITYELVQLMNGTIEVFSKKGKGTRVKLLLNLEIGDANAIEKAFVADNSDKLKGKKVLLVEDNEMNRMLACNTLKRYGLAITEAKNGFDAVEKVRSTPFDLIMMDLQMPVMDGIEATKIIRNELNLTTPIIAFTANAFKNDIEQYLATGMNDYVTKPFEEKVLISTVQKALNEAAEQTPGAAVAGGADKLYSLGKLVELSHGDSGFIKTMLNIFAEHTTSSVQEMKNAFAEGDYDTIRKVAHRIKPGLEKLDVVSLKQDVKFIETFNPDTQSVAELQKAIVKLEEVVSKVVAALAEEDI